MSLRKPEPDKVIEPSIVWMPERTAWWAGRRLLPPDGVLAFPGPKVLRRHRRKAMIRIDLRTSEYMTLNGFYAVAEGMNLNCVSALVAHSADLDSLLVYCTERFHPCSITVVQPEPVSTPDAASPAAGGA